MLVKDETLFRVEACFVPHKFSYADFNFCRHSRFDLRAANCPLPARARAFKQPGDLWLKLLCIQSISAVLSGHRRIGHQHPQRALGLFRSADHSRDVPDWTVFGCWCYHAGWEFTVWRGAWSLVRVYFCWFNFRRFSSSKVNFHFLSGSATPMWCRVFQLMGPRVFGAAIVQSNFWVNNNLGSKMVEGSIQSLLMEYIRN